MSSFAADVRRFADKTRAKADRIVRGVAVEILSRVVMRSPVGNPELWAANAEVQATREGYNARVQIAGDFLSARTGKKVPRALRGVSPRTLAKKYPLRAGKGYVGGRFRGNWLVTIGGPAQGTLNRIDPGGNETLEDGTATIQTAETGEAIYIMNNLPYAQRLEYGYSKQAPAGMVRITAAEFQGIVNRIAKAV